MKGHSQSGQDITKGMNPVCRYWFKADQQACKPVAQFCGWAANLVMIMKWTSYWGSGQGLWLIKQLSHAVEVLMGILIETKAWYCGTQCQTRMPWGISRTTSSCVEFLVVHLCFSGVYLFCCIHTWLELWEVIPRSPLVKSIFQRQKCLTIKVISDAYMLKKCFNISDHNYIGLHTGAAKSWL